MACRAKPGEDLASSLIRSKVCALKFAILLLASAAALPCAAFGQDADTTVVSKVVITGSPLSSNGVPSEDAPYASEVLGADDLTRSGSASVLRALSEGAGQVQLNAAQGNPFQPNVSYRGFEASPLVGNGQGLAIYVDGVRFNQAFGDTTNWDLIPDNAVKSIVVEGSNPVFGLNALGGSMDVRMKTGKDVDGLGAELSGGSFGRYDGSVEYGVQNGGLSFYAAGRALDEDGWRDYSPSRLRQGYADLGFEGDRVQTHLRLLGADNRLIGNATAPVELLAADRSAIFTYPDITENRFLKFSASTDWLVGEHGIVQSVVYAQRLRQSTVNGDAAEIETCDAPYDAYVCQPDAPDEPLTDANGDPISDFLSGGHYAFLNRGSTDSDVWGFTVQYANDSFGRHKVLAGLSLDSGASTFHASSELGALGADRGYEGPGVIVESDDIGSVRVKAYNRYYGVYATDRVTLTPTLTATLSGRYNVAEATLRDQIGTALNGDHRFQRFNPAAALTWTPLGGYVVFGGYSEANRAPTPAELSCADPDAPCSLTNFFIGDPPLKQVVARTWEAGVRQTRGPWRWSFTGYATRTEDDIMFVASPTVGRAYFQNVGKTRRMGAQADVSWRRGPLELSASWAISDATFESPLTLNSPDNPEADADGHIFVTPGDHIPGVARNKIKLTGDWQATDAWRISSTLTYQDGQYLFGDESNDNPKTEPFVTVNLATTYDINERVSLFGSVENLFNARYETFGVFSPVDEVPISELPGGYATDPRSLGPGAPRAIYVGLRLKL